MGDGDWSQGGGVSKVLCGMAFEFDFFGILQENRRGWVRCFWANNYLYFNKDLQCLNFPAVSSNRNASFSN